MAALSRVALASVSAATALAPLARAQAPSLEWRVASSYGFSTCQMVYDVARSRFVALPDGVSGGRELTLSEWAGNSWRLPATTHVPRPRVSFGLAYDMVRGRVVLFGGSLNPSSSSRQVFNDLWEFDGADWMERTTAIRPAPRYSPLMTWDFARNCVLVVGGIADTTLPHNDTWQWNGTSWLSVPAVAPDVNGAAMAAHPPTGRVVLVRPVNFQSSETWTYDGVAWTLAASGASSPPFATSYRATTDLAGGRVVLLGNWLTSVWQWNGTAWSPTPTPFDGRLDCGLAADTSGRVVAFGGMGVTSFTTISTGVERNDTWSIAGGVNTRLDDGGPIAIQSPHVAWDAVRRRLVCVGGPVSTSVPGQTLEYDGSSWRSLGAPLPPAAIDARMCFDLLRGRTVRFGGIRLIGGSFVTTAELSEWNGTQWQVQPSPGPSPRSGHAMTYDLMHGVVLVFGGRAGLGAGSLGDTWQWNGTNWTQVATTGPSPRTDASMAFDLLHANAVLFGGSFVSASVSGSVFGDTWLWNGTNWTQASPTTSPAPRSRAYIDYDLVSQRTVMLGGYGNGQTQTSSELWEWDGVDWRQGATTLPVAARGYYTTGTMTDGQWMLVTSTAAWLGDATPARAVVTGTGCGGASVPALRSYGDPVLGSATFAVELHRTVANAPFLLGLGAGTASAPIGAGCTVYLPQLDDTRLGVAGPTGFARIPLPVPGASQLLGLEVSLQAGALDALAPLGFALSDAVVARIGH